MLRKLATSKRIWLVLALAPLAFSLIGFLQIPAGLTTIPVHWNAAGEIDGYGSPSFVFGLGAIMSLTNAILAILCFNSDKAYDAGLVHGVSKEATPVALFITAIVLVLIHGAIMIATISAVLGAL